MELHLYKRQGVHNREQVFPDIRQDEALQKIALLDGEKHTLVVLDRPDGWQLIVGGGARRFVVTLSRDDQNATLFNPAGSPTRMVELCAGGQYGEYPENLCVGLSEAQNAAKLFFQSQERRVAWS